jgi:hypothetical protein
MSFAEDIGRAINQFIDLLFKGTDIRFQAQPKDGVIAGQPATLKFDATRKDAARVTIRTTDGDVVYEGGPAGSVIVTPTQTTWYRLTAQGPKVHEEKSVQVTVLPSSWSETRSSSPNQQPPASPPHTPVSLSPQASREGKRTERRQQRDQKRRRWGSHQVTR